MLILLLKFRVLFVQKTEFVDDLQTSGISKDPKSLTSDDLPNP